MTVTSAPRDGGTEPRLHAGSSPFLAADGARARFLLWQVGVSQQELRTSESARTTAATGGSAHGETADGEPSSQDYSGRSISTLPRTPPDCTAPWAAATSASGKRTAGSCGSAWSATASDTPRAASSSARSPTP